MLNAGRTVSLKVNVFVYLAVLTFASALVAISDTVTTNVVSFAIAVEEVKTTVFPSSLRTGLPNPVTPTNV
ncbi:hypothetical protein ACFWGC_27555 [Cytobacillus pseudoceanisediminis]|uniref:hypothetical protein n=1 Tax=Cytobacillus pseudoceanisediminis TaxID=3051614 RepID=UPI00365C97FC